MCRGVSEYGFRRASNRHHIFIASADRLGLPNTELSQIRQISLRYSTVVSNSHHVLFMAREASDIYHLRVCKHTVFTDSILLAKSLYTLLLIQCVNHNNLSATSITNHLWLIDNIESHSPQSEVQITNVMNSRFISFSKQILNWSTLAEPPSGPDLT